MGRLDLIQETPGCTDSMLRPTAVLDRSHSAQRTERWLVHGAGGFVGTVYAMHFLMLTKTERRYSPTNLRSRLVFK